jgi:thioredoxin reductase (NADPH)
MAADPSSAGAASTATFSAMHPRHAQTFPTLTPAEIERLRRFGTVRRYADGEGLFKTGEPTPGMFILLSGHVAITRATAWAT